MCALLVPLYVYPSKEKLASWRLIEEAARAGHPMKVIINPDNGPGKKVSSTYAANIAKLAAAGVQMIGYVYTDYGRRALADVKADVLRWREFYPQVAESGFFFDEAAAKADKLAYYNELFLFVTSLAAGYTNSPPPYVVLNPGAVCDEGYMNCANCVVIFESPESSWQKKKPWPAWMSRYAHDKFAIMILQVGEVRGAAGVMTPPTPAKIASVGREALASANWIYMNPKWEGKSSYPELSAPYWSELLKLASS